MNEYQKKGYLVQDFRVFRLDDCSLKPIPFHYHDFHKIILFLSGEAEYIIEGKTYPLAPRDIVFVSAGEVHRPIFSQSKNYERIVIYVAPDFLKRYTRNDDFLDSCLTAARQGSSVMHLNPGKSHDLLYHMDKLEKTAHDNAFANGLYTEILFIEFMILLNRAIREHELDDIQPSQAEPKVQELLTYINQHITEDISIDKLSEITYLSKFHLMRKFKNATGYSIHQYILNKRLLIAKSLLDSDLPITKICYDCGFKDYSTFSRAFKKTFSLTPTDYKNQKE